MKTMIHLSFTGLMVAAIAGLDTHDLWSAETRPFVGKQTKTVRLLTVGNSFSGDATYLLANLAKANGHILVQHAADIGSASMAQHWEKVLRYEKDPQDKEAI